jgi:hypothetical protein
MSTTVHHDGYATAHSHRNFWGRFRYHLVLETKQALGSLRFVFKIFFLAMYGFIKFLFEFDAVKDWFKKLFPFFMIYMSVRYLTLLPTYVAFVLMLVPEKKWVWRGLSVAIPASFFWMLHM